LYYKNVEHNDVVVKVEKIDEIMKYGVMMTPALVVDGKVKVAGKIPSVEEIKRYLYENY